MKRERILQDNDRADAKGCNSSSKFSVSCVVTLQTQPPAFLALFIYASLFTLSFPVWTEPPGKGLILSSLGSVRQRLSFPFPFLSYYLCSFNHQSYNLKDYVKQMSRDGRNNGRQKTSVQQKGQDQTTCDFIVLETVWTEPPGKGLILSSLGSVRTGKDKRIIITASVIIIITTFNR